MTSSGSGILPDPMRAPKMVSVTREKPKDGPRAQPDWVAKVRAIGVDTNAIGSGSFNIVQLQRLTHQAKQHGLELWIPEPVMWEWAEHLRSDRVELNDVRTRLAAAGIQVEPQQVEIDDALSFVRNGLESLGEHVKILSIESVAAEALMDQILLRAPGERISRDGRIVRTPAGKSVKTGASDSAIFRTFLNQARGKTDSYVILSGDSDSRKAHKAWNVDAVRVFKGIDSLNVEIFRMMPAPDHLISSCLDFLRQNLGQVDLTSFKSRNNLVETDLDFAGIGTKVLVGFYDAMLDKPSDVVMCRAVVVTDVLGPEITYDIYGEAHEEPGAQRTYEDSAVNLEITFEVENGAVKSLSMGEVRFTSVIETGDEVLEEDGPLVIIQSLTAVPDMSDFEWDELFYDSAEASFEVDGDPLLLDFSGSVFDEWTLFATYRGAQISISGWPRNDGRQLDEGFVVEATTALTTDSSLVGNHPSLALNALVMNTPRPSST
ncbi:hypothetical protein M1D51_12590 [Arthrobacter sp. R3-55]